LKTSNYLLLLAALVLALTFSGCSSPSADEEQSDTIINVKKVFPVIVEIATAEDVADRFVLPADLEALEDITISAEMSGPVQQIHFAEGDIIKKGDIILEIDSETQMSVLRRDQENVEVIERKVARYQSLEEEGLVSRQDIEDLQNSLVSAREALKSSQLMLSKSQPRSPLDAIVDEVNIDRGEYTDFGKPIIRLLQVDRLKVIADVPEKDIAYLKVGQKVNVVPARIAMDGDPLEGMIEFIAYAADDITRTYRTKIIIDNPGFLRPGMIVRAQFLRQALADVVTVPLYALIDQDGDKFVFLAEQGVARAVPVTIGNIIDQRAVILDGISPGDRVVVKGQQLLVDGSRISEGAD
jgi:membrane fusion protein (multidrug efflux system)